MCVDSKDGSTKWTQKLDASALVLVGDRLVVQSTTGEVTVVEASPKAFRSLGSFKPLDSDECWTQPTVAGNRLFVRSWEGELMAFDLSRLVPPPVAAKPPSPMIPPFKQAAATDWYRWRGPNGDGISPETGLNLVWERTPPKLLFRRQVGHGYSSAAVAGDRLYTAGWSWRHGQGHRLLPQRQQRRRGMESRLRRGRRVLAGTGATQSPHVHGSAPTAAVDGDRLYWLAADGQTFCFDAAGGKVLWYRNLKEDKEAEYSAWFISGSPVVLGDRLLLNTKASGVALDKATGKTLWTSKGRAGLASPVVFAQDGKPRVLFRSPSVVFIGSPLGRQGPLELPRLERHGLLRSPTDRWQCSYLRLLRGEVRGCIP